MTTKRAFAPAAASHETGGIVSIDEWPVLPDVADKDALLQTLLDRDKYMGDSASSALSAALSTLYSNITGDGTWAKITADGGLAVTCTNRSSGTLTAGTVVEPYRGWDVTDSEADITAVDNVVGASNANTDAGVLYFTIVDAGADNTIEAYSDDARTSKVATGTDTGKAGGVISLAAFGGSGLSLDVTVAAAAAAGSTASAMRGSLSGVVKTVVSSIVPCGVIYEDVGSGESGWMTVAGKTMVQFTEDNPFGGYLITSATIAGKVDVLYDLDPTKVQRGVGYCPGRGHLGVGIYGACNLMLGRTWGV